MPSAASPRCLFFARVADLKLLELIEFYREDIETLRLLGYRVVTETQNRRVPLRGRPDIAYVWWHHSSFPAILWLRLLRVPVVVTGAWHPDDSPATLRDSARLLLSRWAARLATINVAISEAELGGFSFLPAGRAVAIPLSVDTEYYVPRPDRLPKAVAITIGQLNPVSIERKGIDLAIRSVPLIVAEVPDYHLHVVGLVTEDGDALIRRLVAASDSEHITIHGGVDRAHKLALLQGSDLYLQLSTIEGFGLAALEALSCGLPVVHSGRGSLPEVVGTAGVEVPGRTAEEVADAVVAVFRQLREGDSLGRQARDQAASLSRVVRTRRLDQLLQAVRVGRGRRHPTVE